MKDIRFNSMEQYLITNAELADELNSPDRDAIKTEERRLLKALDDLGIDKNLFQKERRYIITKEVEELFEYIRLYFRKHYRKQLRSGEFSQIPQTDLVEVRIRLLDALYSLEIDSKSVIETVEKFEMVTNCPDFLSKFSFRALTKEVVEYWKESYRDVLDWAEWDVFSKELEDRYTYEYRPKLFMFALELLKKFAKDHGKELPEESYGLPEIPAGISSDSPSTKTDNQSE